MALSLRHIQGFLIRRACSIGERHESTAAEEVASKHREPVVKETPPKPTGPQGHQPRDLWRLDKFNRFQEVPQAWVESLDSVEGERLDLIDLHPDVWRATPRLDILRRNLDWQNRYRNVVFEKQLSRSELPGSGKKLYPQNAGLGKSRQKSIRSPLWIEGGIAHGIRGPKTEFFMLPQAIRVMGLTSALTIKHAQDDLVVVDSFHHLLKAKSLAGKTKMDTPIWKISEERNWGYSALLVDVSDVAPRQLARQCAKVPGFTPMPLYGLNVYSLLKHETLVITRPALDTLETRLLQHIHRRGPKSWPFRYIDEKERILDEAESEADIFARNEVVRQLQEEDPLFDALDDFEKEELIRDRLQTYLHSRPPPFV